MFLLSLYQFKDNIKLLKQLEPAFKKTTNWNKYLSKITNQGQNRYLDFFN